MILLPIKNLMLHTSKILVRFLNVDVDDNGNTLIGKYYSNNGEVFDEFKIIK
ncbi:MAG TPA: hypothetical protein VK250_11870 [Nitrososphaeraceae archaeon]|nr:hypothetical protein [Nitrososphaeraceae archaeon]